MAGAAWATAADIRHPRYCAAPFTPPQPPTHIRLQCFKHSIALASDKGFPRSQYNFFAVLYPGAAKGTLIVSMVNCDG